jgi:hypothetical protein
MREEQYKMQLKQWEEEENRRRNVAAQQFRATNLGKILDSLNPQQRAVAEYNLANMQGDFEAPESGSRITKLLEQFGGQHSPQPTATMQDFGAFVPEDQQQELYRQMKLKAGTEINMPGAAEEPASLTDLGRLIGPDGKMPPVGISLAEAGRRGYVLREKGATGENLGKGAATSKAAEDMPEFFGLLQNPDGSLKQSVIRDMYINSVDFPFSDLATPMVTGTEGQKAWNFMNQGIQSILRNETGAAFGADEIKNILARYLPSPTEKEEVQKQKLLSYQTLLTKMDEALNPNSAYRKEKQERGITGDDLRKQVYEDVMAGRFDPGPRQTSTPAAGGGGAKFIGFE